MERQQQAWQRAGWALRGGRRARVFVAKRSILCQACQHLILPGEQFSRLLMTSTTNHRQPFCRNCAPFEPE